MNKFIIALLFVFLTIPFLNAQQKAVTESGDKVFLYDDGTWRYVDAKENEMAVNDIPLTTNDKQFKTPKSADFALKSKRNGYKLNLDNKIWNYEKSVVNTEAEYQLKMKEGDLYGILINEAIEVPLEELRDIALLNARSAAPDTELLKQEMRTVNGMDVLYMEFSATLQGIKFHYFNLYASNQSGSTQVLTYTSANLADQYRKSAESLLNGLEAMK